MKKVFFKTNIVVCLRLNSLKCHEPVCQPQTGTMDLATYFILYNNANIKSYMKSKTNIIRQFYVNVCN